MTNSLILQRPSIAECEAKKENKEKLFITSLPNLDKI